jgi:tetratricopeptide (TPR) repeat protein
MEQITIAIYYFSTFARGLIIDTGIQNSKNRETYEDLIASIELCQETLCLLIAVCDDFPLREKIIAAYEREARSLKIQSYRVALGKEPNLKGEIAKLQQNNPDLQANNPAVITVIGAEKLLSISISEEDKKQTELDKFFGYLQWTREGFIAYNYPIVIWITSRIFKALPFRAPDFWSWRKDVFRFISESPKVTPPLEYWNLNLNIEQPSLRSTDEFLPPSDALLATIAQSEKRDPNSSNLVNLYQLLGRAYLKEYLSGNTNININDILSAFDRALEIEPNNSKTWENKGFALTSLEQYEEAIMAFDRALEIEPNNSKTWENKGFALASLEQYEEAIMIFDRALKIEPNNSSAWENKGFALAKLERHQKAIIAYDRALEIEPNNSNTLGNKGVALASLEQYEEAIMIFDRALEIEPNDSNNWESKGFALAKLERYEEAIIAYDRAIEFNNSNSWDTKGVALAKLKRYEEAIIAFDRALKIETNNSNAWYNKSCLYALQDNINLALENLSRAIELNPKWREEAKTESDFDNIRNDARFQELLSPKNDDN